MRLVPLLLQTTRFYRSPAIAKFSTTTALSATPPEKPSYPVDYKVPDVWVYNEESMKPIHGSNLPTSGAQTTKELPKGEHDIQLYACATPNGVKASILLEEICDLKGIEYDAWFIDFGQGDQFTSGFVKVNPNSKIPAIYDQSTGARVFESGAILIYLAEKYDAFIPKDPVGKAECMSWVIFQTGAAPSYGGGGLAHFKNGAAPMNW
jgi:GSH-dependent disulfide-bond oxidoreductase